ncbi:hypothetical protein HOL21_01225 [Candidatus Woesearchaeota archaeon]|jgi:predicted ribosome quality control (RQC) complex YloA/Tae2 family protein|nr:hypothetical protein [Candidatus Woesearchaeota archaeon]MBT5396814.1 hypothetical protein [Candidatus Woesearchaeota archaeon]MBT5924454.1 hypothetical protein [Candidatus Woesearchaeota archaeon]MBT6367702.1 hypothetical protein [Candidatus Woesearchaeota archaeon]MBT7762897.1 hypothetical protein [Candidatus Woesearchaeota archaeon]
MQKKSIASIELAALVHELQFIVNGRISQIYHQSNKELLLQLHASGKGKQLLKIIPGKLISLTTKKETQLRPTGFCMQLRKYINNAFVRKIEQKDSERIVVFELEKEKKYYLIIELFSKGNIILTDDKYIIITSIDRQIWKDRVVKPHEKYIFPAKGVNWKTITEKELSGIITKSDKKNIATTLATELGFGGLYAEEVCTLSNVDKNILPNEIGKEHIKQIYMSINKILKKIEKPQGHIYDEQITPFLLEGKEPKKVMKTYNEAIDTLNPFLTISPYEQKIGAVTRMVRNQEEAIVNLTEKIALNKQKGELIYEKYTPLQKLLDIVKELRKVKDWKDVEKELKKEKKIAKVDLKNKKVLIEL